MRGILYRRLAAKANRIENGKIFFGFNRQRLSELQSIGTEYTSRKFNPDSMLLTFKDGSAMSLLLKRVSSKGAEQIISHVEANYPQCQIDPTLTSLIRCQKTARKIVVETDNKLIIPYNGRRHLQEIQQTFTDLHTSWLHLGPAVVVLFCAPIWLTTMSVVYWAGHDLSHTASWISNNVASGIMLTQIAIASTVATGLEPMMWWITNPFVWAISFACILFFGWQLLKLTFLPTNIRLDDSGLFLDETAALTSFQRRAESNGTRCHGPHLFEMNLIRTIITYGLTQAKIRELISTFPPLRLPIDRDY